MKPIVSKFRLPDGKHDVFIHDELGIPICIDLQKYVATRLSGYAINTRTTYAQSLVFMFNYFMKKNIDIPNRIESGEFFTKEELQGFFTQCHYSVDHEQFDDSNVTSFERFSGKRLDMFMHASVTAEHLVKSDTAKFRLTRFKDYIEWLHDNFHFYANPTDEAAQKYTVLIREIKKQIKKLKDESNKTKDPFEPVIPDDVYEKLLETIDPNSSDNTFKRARHRNQLIIYVLTESGIRKSALLKLKLSDVKADWDNPRILITRTPNDPSDPRKHKPEQKTKAHSAALSQKTMIALKFYIEHIRVQFPAASNHDFVFVSEKGRSAGQPLSSTGFNYIFEVLSESLGFRLTPHMMRHKWNEVFDANAEDAGLTPDVIDDIRKNSMGWSENTKMISTYNEKRLAEKASKLSAARQREQFGKRDNKDD